MQQAISPAISLAQQTPKRIRIAWLLLLGILLMAVMGALLAGSFSVSFAEIGHVIYVRLAGMPQSGTLDTIIWQVRIPRIFAALLLGTSLAAAGAVFQALLRNPLVSPDILGVSAGSGLGAVIAMLLGLSLFWLQVLAFLGGLAAVFLVYSIASLLRQRDPILMLVLAGIAIGTMLGAGISVVKVIADPYDQLPGITYWLLGGLNGVSMAELSWAAPLILAALTLVYLLRWHINVLSFDDEQASALGINVARSRWWLIAAATLMTACAVSFSGIVGWVGLLVPHIARLWVGPNMSRLLPFSMVLGASFVLLTDTLARSVSELELPLGVLTALLGGPFFLFVLLRSNRP